MFLEKMYSIPTGSEYDCEEGTCSGGEWPAWRTMAEGFTTGQKNITSQRVLLIKNLLK